MSQPTSLPSHPALPTDVDPEWMAKNRKAILKFFQKRADLFREKYGRCLPITILDGKVLCLCLCHVYRRLGELRWVTNQDVGKATQESREETYTAEDTEIISKLRINVTAESRFQCHCSCPKEPLDKEETELKGEAQTS